MEELVCTHVSRRGESEEKGQYASLTWPRCDPLPWLCQPIEFGYLHMALDVFQVPLLLSSISLLCVEPAPLPFSLRDLFPLLMS